MKYVVVLGDGMADLPIKKLNGRTPLEVANIENMDFIASHGKVGLLKTLVEGMPIGSEVANLSILGYSPEKYYPGGRGPLEAPCMGVKLKDKEIAIRTNFVNVEQGILKHYSAGEISTDEGKILCEELNRKLGNEEIKFYQGKEYRGLLVLKNSQYSEKAKCWPPHEINDKKIEDYLPKALNKKAEKTTELLRELTLESEKILSQHPINKKRISHGKEPANMLWFWGIGRYKEMPNFREKFKINGALISAVTLLKGIGLSIGLSVPEVPGATANLSTNYEGKVDCALKELKQNDFVYIHVKAPDDLSHNGDFENKIKAIELIDKRIIGGILNSLTGENFRIAILPDHTTSTELRKHTLDPVPFAIYSPEEKSDSVKEYNEKAARQGYYGLQNGTDFMKILLKNGNKKH